ncbi:hypothetical protein N7493_000523 [Penicillium malachiteum]|uniref:Reverse transcriptase RNase H-like domain-containing protein n=1 Tax=Penicillium malachiteum TaxID=1324776 RepID=A0AAD6N0X7_9EURO|nr:hypothetical protein N7493_000523 [Penicillium malachiteum]
MTTLSAWTVSSRRTPTDEVPVMFMSFGLTGPETRYHTSEREMLAVLKSYRGILGKQPDLTGRMTRWQHRLQEYDLSVIHVPGKTKRVADGLSRLSQWHIAELLDEDGLTIPAMVLKSSNLKYQRQYYRWGGGVKRQRQGQEDDENFVKEAAIGDRSGKLEKIEETWLEMKEDIHK